MKIGRWDLQPFLSGEFKLDGGAMFGVVPKNIWARVAPPDDENRISMVMRLLLMRDGDRVVVVDAGCGRGYGDKLSRIYGFQSNVPMPEALEPFGVAAEDVTDVLVTHLHFDHGGGLATPDGDGWKLTFPNATHHIQQSQWDHALNPNPRDKASYFRHRIELIGNEGRLELYEGEWAFAPDVQLLPFDGHTDGQHLPLIQGDGKSLFYTGDLIPTSVHLPTPFIMAYDLQPVVAMEEKVSILTRAAAEDWILFFEHDPLVEACTVENRENRFLVGQTLTL